MYILVEINNPIVHITLMFKKNIRDKNMSVMKLKVLPVNFKLAKFLIDEWHRTNFAPVGHKASYIMIKETGNYEPVAHPEASDFFYNWFDEAYPDNDYGDDFIFQADENGDPLVSSLGKIIGVVVIGRPVARFKDKNIMELTRICFNPKFNPLKDGFELPSQLVKKSIE